jgi:hypothetical protein
MPIAVLWLLSMMRLPPVAGLGSVVCRERRVVEDWLLKSRPPALLALAGSAVMMTGV